MDRDDYEKQAREFVQQHWKKIEKLAKRILEEPIRKTKTLPGTEVLAFFSG